MTLVHPSLPLGAPVDPAPLVRTMRAVTNSYKHLFLRALLRAAESGGQRIRFENLFYGMLEEAWWPSLHYRLHLGMADQVYARLLAEVTEPDRLRWEPHSVRAALRRIPFDPVFERSRGLLRHVPQRLLSTWFAEEMAGMPDGRRDRALERLSNEAFTSRSPLYRILPDAIELHPDWAAYIERNIAMLWGWSDAGWLDYLEARNPNVPGLGEKIRPDVERQALTEQRRLWRALIQQGGVSCIYTGQAVNPDSFAVDHFLPRAFLAHDRLWNLTPISAQLNSLKRDRLPADEFVDSLARQHSAAARRADALSGPEAKIWRRASEQFSIDLRIDPDHVRSPEKLGHAYGEMFGALTGIARRMGFEAGWRPIQ